MMVSGWSESAMDKVKAFGSFRRGCCAFMDRRGPFPWQDELFL